MVPKKRFFLPIQTGAYRIRFLLLSSLAPRPPPRARALPVAALYLSLSRGRSDELCCLDRSLAAETNN